MPLHFELTTPERVVLTEEVDGVTIPTMSGEITVLPHHAPLVSVLSSGVLTVRHGADEDYIAVTGGFIEILPGNKLVVLADVADRAEELDQAAVEAARDKARKLLTEERYVDDVSAVSAVAALERELARIKTLERFRGRRGAGAPRAPEHA
jgi:F-type H+-transporting ATPase subunit epsilon